MRITCTLIRESLDYIDLYLKFVKDHGPIYVSKLVDTNRAVIGNYVSNNKQYTANPSCPTDYFIRYNGLVYKLGWDDFILVDNIEEIPVNSIINFSDVIGYYREQNISNLLSKTYKNLSQLLEEEISPNMLEETIHQFLGYESVKVKTKGKNKKG